MLDKIIVKVGRIMKENIVLVGYMGSGKTTVGTQLASNLNYQFVDTDQKIEEEQGKTISQIFSDNGEEYFRDIETDTVKKMLSEVNHSIISTGGGLPLRECNGEILKKLGFVVFLRVKKETVLERLKGDTTRPLLQGEKVEEKVDNMLSYRNPIYEYSAHLQVEVDHKTVEEIVEEIIRNYNILIKKDKHE